jgi:CelD/BcsL family acetyltransferase involved in cellulose biosynthesis
LTPRALIASRALLQVHCHESLDELEVLRPDWEELLSRTSTASIFSTWEWLASWWRAYGEGKELQVLAFRDPESRLVALAPLCLDALRVGGLGILRRLRLMGDGSGDSDNLDLPVWPGQEPAFARALLDQLLEKSSHWDLCSFETLPPDSPAAAALRHELQERRWPHANYPLPRSAVELPESWESYLERISPKERDKLAYYSRRLEKRHRVCFIHCTEEGGLSRGVQALFRLHQKRWERTPEPGSFASSARRQFYDEMSSAFLRRGWLELWLLELDGEIVAAQFGFRYRDTVYALQEGFDPDLASDSVGFVLRGHVLRQLIGAGVRRYDFLAGLDPSKDRWGAQASAYVNLHFARPHSRGGAHVRLSRDTYATKEWLRARLPERALLAVRRLRLQRRR